ncbi:hypothetical protein SUGI_0696490 [Cryptomeria japonica]|nr:hypothetical protein SUGI_0696490 [Cryptomeria japonica]
MNRILIIGATGYIGKCMAKAGVSLGYPIFAFLNILKAIKAAGNIKRFLPSEFGNEVDRIKTLPAFERINDIKKTIHRVTEERQGFHTRSFLPILMLLILLTIHRATEDLEATQLYPEYKFTSVDEFLDICKVNPSETKIASFV